jgi:hypothetical protein
MPQSVPEELSRTIETLYRSESGRILATPARLLGDLDVAEEAMHEAFAAALVRIFCVEAVDPSLIPQMLKVRDQFVDAKTSPASTFVVIKWLVRPEWLIEIEVVVVVNR